MNKIFPKSLKALPKFAKKIIQPLQYKFNVNPWLESWRRPNTLIFVRLQELESKSEKASEQEDNAQKEEIEDNKTEQEDISKKKGSSSKKRLCVSNYHMPCAFWSNQVMVIHSALAVAKSQELARDDPLVVAGDWNLLPDSSQYRLITTNVIDKTDPAYPPQVRGEFWTPRLRYAMKSAYKESQGKEPEFTNYARTYDSDSAFIGTIDYIFVSPKILVHDVLSLPAKDKVRGGGPLPNAYEPSDHILIAANISY